MTGSIFKIFYERYWSWRLRESNYRAKGVVPDRIQDALNCIQGSLKVAGNASEILDIGCGEGILGQELKKRFGTKITVCGLDISERAIAEARLYYDKVYQSDVNKECLSDVLGDRTFDYVVCLEVMEHILYPEKLLKEIKRILKPTGVLLTSIPNFAFFKNRMSVLSGRFPVEQHIFHPAEHIHYFTFGFFKEFLNKNEFTIFSIYGGTCTLFFPFSFLPLPVRRKLFRTLPNLFGKQILFCCKQNNVTN